MAEGVVDEILRLPSFSLNHVKDTQVLDVISYVTRRSPMTSWRTRERPDCPDYVRREIDLRQHDPSSLLLSMRAIVRAAEGRRSALPSALSTIRGQVGVGDRPRKGCAKRAWLDIGGSEDSRRVSPSSMFSSHYLTRRPIDIKRVTFYPVNSRAVQISSRSPTSRILAPAQALKLRALLARQAPGGPRPGSASARFTHCRNAVSSGRTASSPPRTSCRPHHEMNGIGLELRGELTSLASRQGSLLQRLSRLPGMSRKPGELQVIARTASIDYSAIKVTSSAAPKSPPRTRRRRCLVRPRVSRICAACADG